MGNIRKYTGDCVRKVCFSFYIKMYNTSSFHFLYLWENLSDERILTKYYFETSFMSKLIKKNLLEFYEISLRAFEITF